MPDYQISQPNFCAFQTSSANCLAIDGSYIYIGCADGIVRIFSANTLHFIHTLPKPHALGVDVAAGVDPT